MLAKLRDEDKDLGKHFAETMGDIKKLVDMVEKQKANQILDLANVHLDTVCARINAVLANSLVDSPSELAKHCEQLNLHASSLPESYPRRDQILETADFANCLFKLHSGLIFLERLSKTNSHYLDLKTSFN